jgi:hypothetical protein
MGLLLKKKCMQQSDRKTKMFSKAFHFYYNVIFNIQTIVRCGINEIRNQHPYTG